MKIAIRKEPNGSVYIDKKIFYDNRFTEEILSQPPYNYTKVEVDEQYADCIGADFNDDLTFDVEKYNTRNNKYLLKNELNELKTWFNYYDNQVAQYNRCKRLEMEFDKDINELDNQAKINQERIAQIRNLLKEN